MPLLGITGAARPSSVANVTAKSDDPLVMALNKTLAAQLYAELKAALPEQRGRVRQLLRSLPARSLHPDDRTPSIGEGRDHQRRHRPDASRGDALAACAGAT
ncbi:MAG: hypothetical protein R3B99_05415 [Polyangiales bacterium]